MKFLTVLCAMIFQAPIYTWLQRKLAMEFIETRLNFLEARVLSVKGRHRSPYAGQRVPLL